MPPDSNGSYRGYDKTADAFKVITTVPAAHEIHDGRQVVTTPGTAVALAASTVCKRVTITAETNNTDMVVVGGSTVVAALVTRRGTPLNPGDSYSQDTDNLSEVFIDALVATEGVTFTYTV